MSDRAGAVGYLLKDRVSDVGQFIDTVRRVAAGATVMDPEVVASLLARHEGDEPLQALTPREREVLSLMAEGRSNAAIAARMFVTEKAVSKHSNNIFTKLGLSSPRRTTGGSWPSWPTFRRDSGSARAEDQKFSTVAMRRTASAAFACGSVRKTR